MTWVDLVWVLFSLANLACILIFSHWETIPFHFIWISLTLLYGFRVWATRPTLWVLGMVMAATFAAIGWDVYIGAQSVDELNEVPLMAAMFWMMVWHAQRRQDADQERDRVSDENARLLAKFYQTEHGTVAIVGLDENDTQANATSFTHKEGVGYPVAFDPGSNVVDVCVRRLRSKLGFDLIKTVRGEGYQLTA